MLEGLDLELQAAIKRGGTHVELGLQPPVGPPACCITCSGLGTTFLGLPAILLAVKQFLGVGGQVRPP